MVAENVAQAQISPKDFCVTTVRLHKFENCFFTLDRLSGRSASSILHSMSRKSQDFERKKEGSFEKKAVLKASYVC